MIDSKFAFADKLMVPADELLVTVRYRHSLREEEAADAQVIELASAREKSTVAVTPLVLYLRYVQPRP